MNKKVKDESISYDSKERFNSYWHQINEIVNLNPNNILEIGIGSKFLADYLEKHNFDVTIVDIEREIHGLYSPDVQANMISLPFCEECFEVVTAFEVLEHIPFKNVEEALNELYRVSNSYVIISVPDVRAYLKTNLEFTFFLKHKKLLVFPLNQLIFKSGLNKLIGGREEPEASSHYWEIGRKNYPLKRIKRKIKKANFEILKDYRIYELHHHFFLLKK